MAIGDLYTAEIYYQNQEEVLSITFHYIESTAAEPSSACKSLADGLSQVWGGMQDLAPLLPDTATIIGVRVVCVTDDVHNPYEQQILIDGTGNGSLPDLYFAQLVLTGLDANGDAVQARYQWSMLTKDSTVGSVLNSDYQRDLRIEIWPEIQVVDGNIDGQFALAIPHKPDPLGPIDPRFADDLQISSNVGSRLDRRGNYPNTGRKDPDEVAAVAAFRKQWKADRQAEVAEAKVKKPRRTRAERNAARKEALK